ncbi:MAG: 2-oxoacid:acceptor oxidoreductase family protein [Filifactoraceae bacterium]
MRKEIRLSGSGGQGIIMLGIVLAEAAINLGMNAVQSQSYGPEARGGASKAEVIISDKEINFTKVIKPTVFLALTQDAFDKYRQDIEDDGIIVVDESITLPILNKNIKVYSLPILRTAQIELKKPMVANIVSLGALTKILGLDEKAVMAAAFNRVPKGTEELNLSAFSLGFEMV